MSLSLNSVVHYTNFECLKSIISESAFRIKYCLEEVNSIGSAFPMICFCDIPYDQVSDHRWKYGNCSIGLTKEWARTKGINPVLYFNEGSYLDKLFRDQGKKLDEDMRSDEPKSRYWLDNFISILSFVKRVEGKIVRNGKEEIIKFYDEREWRYVPTWNELSVLKEKFGFVPSRQIYGPTYEFNKDKMNSYLSDFRVKFQLADISEIYVSIQQEIDELIDYVSGLNIYFSGELEILHTKIKLIEG